MATAELTTRDRIRTRYGKSRIASTIMEITSATAPRQLGLYDELALAKVMLADAVSVYEQLSKILGIERDYTDPELLMKLHQSLAMMHPNIRALLETVLSVAKTATDIEMTVAISPDMLAYLAGRIEQVIQESVKDPELRAELEHELLTTFAETTIRSQQTQQTILSPAATVKAIDDSVPHVECDEASYATRLKTTAATDEELPSWENYHDLEQEGLEK